MLERRQPRTDKRRHQYRAASCSESACELSMRDELSLGSLFPLIRGATPGYAWLVICSGQTE
jgi:hypothetical protein